MKVRLVRSSDGDELYDLFRSVSVTRKDLVSGEIPQSGFFEYPLSHADISLRASNPPFSLVMEDEGRIVAYILGYDKEFASERISLSNHGDPIIERFSQVPLSCVYLDQLFLRPGLPVFVAARLMDTWEYITRGERIEGVFASIPQGEWTNNSSLRFAFDRGFSKKGRVNSSGVNLGVFSKPYLNLDEELKL